MWDGVVYAGLLAAKECGMVPQERERDDMCTDHYLIRKFPCCVTGEMFAHAQVHDVWIG